MPRDLERLAADLAKAWAGGGTIPLPPMGEAPASRLDAYLVQDRMAEKIGGRVAGWKVGATVRAVQVFEGHDGPLPGRIFADRCFDSPAQVPARLFPGVKIECEFAFRLNEGLAAGGAVTAEALAPILTFLPAIELSASRYAPGTGGRAATTFDGIADNGSGGAVVLGAAVKSWRDLPFQTMSIDARIDASPPIQAYSGPYRRHPLEIAAETFTDLRARQVALPSGTLVLTGSLTLPTSLRPGQTLTVRFADLPPLSLRLTG
jgi:2-keto-4-pentenoate hydratase